MFGGDYSLGIGKTLSAALPHLPKSFVRRVAGRYVAGETREEAVALARDLKARGFLATIDRLGENAGSWDEAEQAAAEYLTLMNEMSALDIDRNISIKLTALGLRNGRNRAFELFSWVLDKASESDFFVRIDMEDASVTDATLEIYKRALKRWNRIGPVLQARLRRTASDAEELAAKGANVRLCKGIYPESEEIALSGKEEIRESYISAARRFLEAKSYVAFATHDLPLIEKLKKEITAAGASPADFEFQALLGVPMREALENLRDAGFKVRLYLPYGSNWYEYSLRRLKENPRIAAAAARGFFRLGRS